MGHLGKLIVPGKYPSEPLAPTKRVLDLEGDYTAPELREKARRAGIIPTGASKRELLRALIEAGVI